MRSCTQTGHISLLKCHYIGKQHHWPAPPGYTYGGLTRLPSFSQLIVLLCGLFQCWFVLIRFNVLTLLVCLVVTADRPACHLCRAVFEYFDHVSRYGFGRYGLQLEGLETSGSFPSLLPPLLRKSSELTLYVTSVTTRSVNSFVLWQRMSRLTPITSNNVSEIV